MQEPQQRQPGVVPPLSALFIAFLRLGRDGLRRARHGRLHPADGGGSKRLAERARVRRRRGALPGGAWRDGDADGGVCRTKGAGSDGGGSRFVGFGLPAFVLMLALSAAYARTHNLPGVISAFSGLQAIVVAIVANAAVSFGLTTLKHWQQVLITGLAVALYSMSINPCLVVIAAALLGLWLLKEGASALPPRLISQPCRPQRSP